MTSSQGESKVINLLRELMVATLDVLCNKLLQFQFVLFYP
jgi:hypothetical protein